MCGHQFQSRQRRGRCRAALWRDYVWRRRTLDQLALECDSSVNWVREQLAAVCVPLPPPAPRPIVLIIDATFFSRGDGLLVAKDAHAGGIVYHAFIASETVECYRTAKDTLEGLGYTVRAVVIDGRRGVRELFRADDIPVQHCQFHQLQAITQCLTRRPRLEANRELRQIAMTLPGTTKTCLERDLAAWHSQWEAWLKERTYVEETSRWHYTHRRTRRAYQSLLRNLDYLFTYQEYPELEIPNTTNRLEGWFTDMKERTTVHRGARRSFRNKIILEVITRAHKP